jgi:hypothetical protein
MSLSSVIRPSKRTRHIDIKPSAATAEYPIKDFLVPTSDPHGRTVTLSTTTAPAARRVASIILTKRLFGFQNEQDVWRWCIDNGLNVLERKAKDKDVTSEISVMNAIVATAKDNLEQLQYIDMLKLVGLTIDKLMADGHPVKAEQLAESIWRHADQLADPYWRKAARDKAHEKLTEVRRRIAKLKKSGAAE